MWILDQSRRSRGMVDIDVIMLWHGKFLWSPWRAFWISLSVYQLDVGIPAREGASFRKFCCIAKNYENERIEKNESSSSKKSRAWAKWMALEPVYGFCETGSGRANEADLSYDMSFRWPISIRNFASYCQGTYTSVHFLHTIHTHTHTENMMPTM